MRIQDGREIALAGDHEGLHARKSSVTAVRRPAGHGVACSARVHTSIFSIIFIEKILVQNGWFFGLLKKKLTNK